MTYVLPSFPGTSLSTCLLLKVTKPCHLHPPASTSTEVLGGERVRACRAEPRDCRETAERGAILSTFFVARFALGGQFCPSRALWAALQGTVPLSAKGTFRSQHRRHTAIPSSSAWQASALKYHLHSSSDSSIFFDVHACCQQPCQPSHSITGPHHRFSHQTESATWYMKITTHLKC